MVQPSGCTSARLGGVRWLSIDPGETTGWALWEGDQLVEAGQAELPHFLDDVGDSLGVGYGDSTLNVEGAYLFQNVGLLVIERFALYPWKASQLDFDEMRTSQGIGTLRWIAKQAGVRVVMQPATIKRPALEGGARELFFHPLYENRHANDAIMHGWYFIAVEMRGVKITLPGEREVLTLDPELIYLNEGGADGAEGT